MVLWWVKPQTRETWYNQQKRKQMISMTMAPVKCPRCKGTTVSKNGKEKGKQRYSNSTNHWRLRYSA